MADVDAANALASSAKGDLFPKIGVEARGRIGDDIDAVCKHATEKLGLRSRADLVRYAIDQGWLADA